MSADNAIGILVTNDTQWKEGEGCWTNMWEPKPIWRVAHLQNPESFDEYRREEFHNLGYWMHSVFGDAPAFKSEEEARAAAFAMEGEIGFVEYGVMIFDARPLNFPGH